VAVRTASTHHEPGALAPDGREHTPLYKPNNFKYVTRRALGVALISVIGHIAAAVMFISDEPAIAVVCS
jgi:hypothetical protein